MKYSIFYENKSSQVNDDLMEIDTENLEFEVDSEKFEHAINFQIEQKKVLVKEQFQESRWSLTAKRKSRSLAAELDSLQWPKVIVRVFNLWIYKKMRIMSIG